MVPELEALEERGYFSRGEIRAIVQKRQDFEYALKRTAARKEDYLRWAPAWLCREWAGGSVTG
jgi:U3 small nucleolar RNA-associated protein 6